jgi:[ribosomal protein S5]-alanine N-acetyltransferase
VSTLLEVRTPRLLLRPLWEIDRNEFLRVHALSAEFFRPWAPSPPEGESPEGRFRRALDEARRGAASGTHVSLVGLLDDGRIAGFFTLYGIFRGAFQSAYAGWGVSADQAGRGYGTEAVTGLLDLAFAPPDRGLGLHRVQANMIPSNAASRRLAAKVGFREEGLALRYLQIAGEWRDHVMYARTVEEHTFTYLDPGSASGG